ncbi:hypothetical protein, partial [Rhodococcus sp. T7]|uniref:hypothetical protein n=1 Tax=Rhodococcus sp. T7 TaxID=627444 RepID=UPI0013588B82
RAGQGHREWSRLLGRYFDASYQLVDPDDPADQHVCPAVVAENVDDKRPSDVDDPGRGRMTDPVPRTALVRGTGPAQKGIR